MNTYQAAAELMEQHPWLKGYERDLESAILREAKHWTMEGVKPWIDAVDKAYQLTNERIQHAHEYRVDLDDFDDILRFLSNRRPGVVWTILVTKHHLRLSK